MRPFALAVLALLAATSATAQTLYEVRQESAPGAGDFDSQPLLGTVAPYDGSSQTAEAYYNRASGPPYTWQGSRPTYSNLGTNQTSLFLVETSEGLTLMVVMGAMSQSNSLWTTTTSGPFSGLGVIDDPANADDSFAFAGGTLTAGGKIGSGFGDGYGLILEESAAAPIYFELDSGTNGFDASGAGLQVLGDNGASGNTFVRATLADNRRLRLAPLALEIGTATPPADVPGWRLLSAPVGGLDVLDFAAINYVGGVPAGAVNAAQYPGQGRMNPRGQLAGNLFHVYSGLESTPHHDDASRDSVALVYVPAPDTDYTFQPGQGIWWYWYDADFDLGATSGGGVGQSYDLLNPLFGLSAVGQPFAEDVTVSFPLSTVLPADFDGDGDGEPDTGVFRDRFYMGGNPFSQPFNVDGISATNGTVQGLVYSWDPAANGGEGNHVPYVRSGALDGSGDAAAVWQGLMIEVTPTAGAIAGNLGPDITYDYSLVQASADPAFYGLTATSAPVPTSSLLSTSSAPSQLHFTLTSAMQSGRTSEDQMWIRFLPDATPDYDPHDASKFSLSAAQIAVVGKRGRERVRLGMAAGPDGSTEALPRKMNVKMTFSAQEAGIFTLAWDKDLAEGWQAMLIDRVTGDKVRIRRGGSYTFTSDATEWTERFIVRIRPAEIAATLAPAAGLTLAESAIGQPHPNPAAGSSRIEVVLAQTEAVRVAVYDALGREVAVVQDGEMGAGSHSVALPVSRLAQGAYLVRIEAGSLTETRRLTVVR